MVTFHDKISYPPDGYSLRCLRKLLARMLARLRCRGILRFDGQKNLHRYRRYADHKPPQALSQAEREYAELFIL